MAEKKKLKELINSLRELRQKPIHSDDLDKEQLYYLTEGYREGLCSAAMMLADELDALYDGSLKDTNYLEEEEDWWHDHDEKRINEKVK